MNACDLITRCLPLLSACSVRADSQDTPALCLHPPHLTLPGHKLCLHHATSCQNVFKMCSNYVQSWQLKRNKCLRFKHMHACLYYLHAACERTLKTPLPTAYTRHTSRFLVINFAYTMLQSCQNVCEQADNWKETNACDSNTCMLALLSARSVRADS